MDNRNNLAIPARTLSPIQKRIYFGNCVGLTPTHLGCQLFCPQAFEFSRLMILTISCEL